MPDGGAGGGGDAPGASVGAIGPAGVSEGSDIGGSHGGQTSAPGPTSGGGLEGVVDAVLDSTNPMNNPEMTAATNALGLMGFAPLGLAMSFGQVATSVTEALGGEVGSSEPGGPTGGSGPGLEQPEGREPLVAGNSGHGMGLQFGSAPLDSMPVIDLLPDSRPETPSVPIPELGPEPDFSESEEAQRLRRARRYFGLSETNVTGPLGLQTPAPVLRPSATPIPTGKRKLGA